MSRDEHCVVIGKLSQYIDELIPQELPTFIYQLLKLCRFQSSKCIFIKLQHYFGSKIYDSVNVGLETNSVDLDLIGKIF